MSVPTALQVRSSAGLYGADRVVLALDGALQRGGAADSRILAIRNYRMSHQPLFEAAQARGQRPRLLPCRGRLDPATAAALAAEIGPRGATVVHAHDYKSAFYAWLATRQRPAPLVATLHGWTDSSRALRVYGRMELALLRRFDALVVVARAQAERLLQAGVPAVRIHQVDNGIELPAAAADPTDALRRALGLAPEAVAFAAVARLAPEKNLDLLLEAFAVVAREDDRVVLLVIGDGPERAALQAQALRLGLGERARFLGECAGMDRVYPAVDCLVLSSRTEGMPLVVLEAMAHGLPVVATAVGDVPRLLAQSAHGRLVPPADSAALAAALREAAAEAGARDAAARAFVLERHAPERMAAAYLDIYDAVLERAHGRKAS